MWTTKRLDKALSLPQLISFKDTKDTSQYLVFGAMDDNTNCIFIDTQLTKIHYFPSNYLKKKKNKYIL